MIDMHGVLARLSVDRPLFHSEADFQHALAWRVQCEHPDAKIRLETRPERGTHLDLLLDVRAKRIAIELKYWVARFEGEVGGEHYDLPNRGGHAIARYDFARDVSRLERCIDLGYADQGWAIALTNDPAYWTAGTKLSPVDLAFRIHNGSILNGQLCWRAGAGSGSGARGAVLTISGRYTCRWREYATVRAPTRTDSLWYLALPIEDVRDRPDHGST